ncbi:MAG: glycosyltransferase [Geminicoccaceae bacterium]|nr:glycosyltransferase [Geminicoccaceae bacterium]
MILYLLLLAAVLLHAPDALYRPEARSFIFIIGVVGIWRYGWGLVHFVRALIYKHRTFPRWRRYLDRLLAALDDPEGAPDTGAHAAFAAEAESLDRPAAFMQMRHADPGSDRPHPASHGHAAGAALAADLLPDAYIVVTAYRVGTETISAVFRAAFAEAQDYGRPVCIVASVVEMADQRHVKRLFQTADLDPRVRLLLVRAPPTGKRDGLALALRTVARQAPARDSAVILMDADTILPPGSLRTTLPFLRLLPHVAGLTTDEDSVVAGSRLMHHWHRLRFAQRQVLMCSMALSSRLLTLTGRMSVFRSQVAIDPGFIDAVRDDVIDHWRLGRIKLLTGEDKSTWFWLLKHGMKMIYVPDVRVVTIEHPPSPWFLSASTQLMTRWFGNMLRASGRAIALGPRRIGPFTWWCLIDQRVSMWTPLLGPLAAGFYAVLVSPIFLYAYLAWVLLTRLVQTLMLLPFRASVSGAYPLLLYYNQVYGACVKTYMLFRLDRQRWTRQQIEIGRIDPHPWRRQLRAAGSLYVHLLALTTLVAAVGYLTGLLTWPAEFDLAGL